MARMYDPMTARFLQEDSYRGDTKDPLSLNLYTYCVNNPLVYADPTGHWPEFLEMASKFISTGEKVVAKVTSTIDNTISSIENKVNEKVVEFISDPKREILAVGDGISSGFSKLKDGAKNIENAIVASFKGSSKTEKAKGTYRVNVGESGKGFWGKIADIWVSSPIYNSLAYLSEWQDNHPKITGAIGIIGTIADMGMIAKSFMPSTLGKKIGSPVLETDKKMKKRYLKLWRSVKILVENLEKLKVLW